MATIIEDVSKSADWIAHAMHSSGYRADFTPQSLLEIDRFFDEHSSAGIARPGGLLAKDLGQRLFAIGSYIGEVARRKLGGEWSGNELDPRGEIDVELHLPSNIRCWPVQRVMKRFKNGPEDSIAAWGVGLGLHVESSPESLPKSFLKKLFG